MDLVLDIGNLRIEGAIFESDTLIDAFKISPQIDAFNTAIEKYTVEKVMIASINAETLQTVSSQLSQKELPYSVINSTETNLTLDVEEPESISPKRIANCYGALHRFPQSDCVIVNLSTAITFDAVSASGHYYGGAIYPGMSLSAKALHTSTDFLPDVIPAKPQESVAKSIKTHVQSGLYYGLLGAVERVSFEMRQSFPSPSNVKVLATGGIFHESIGEDLNQDIRDLVDFIDPMLTLVGIHEIMKEKT